MPETVRQQLATSLLGEPVGPWILKRHRAKCSYKDISDELAKATGGRVCVTRQAIGLWRQVAASEEGP